eukprot:12757370-Alexandrium_andersonii.AAC.1
MVTMKTIESRRHPKIPASCTDIVWPYYLQVKLSTETTRNRKRAIQQHTHEEHIDIETFDQQWGQFEQQAKRARQGAMHEVPEVPNPQEEQGNTPKAESNEAI